MTDPVQGFQTIHLSARSRALEVSGRHVIHMEFGQPSTGAPAAAIAAAHRVLDRQAMGYWESAPLKDAIARRYHEQYGVRVASEQIVLTAGASPALVLALLAGCSPGAGIAIARPGYVAYRNTVAALGMMPMELDCGAATRFQLNAEMLAALDPAPQGVIVASPANPTGTILDKDDLCAIAGICAERGIRIISDEIYHRLSYGRPTHSLLEFDPGAMVINSFSKYFSMAGWRLGWLVAPPEIAPRAHARMSNLFLTPPELAQHAALIALDCTDELDGHVETYRRNRALLLERLPAMGIDRIAPPDGAFYIYADIRHLTDDSLAFCLQLLEDTGVATATGVDFDPVDGHHFMRFSFAVGTGELSEALDRMTPWFAARAAEVASRGSTSGPPAGR